MANNPSLILTEEQCVVKICNLLELDLTKDTRQLALTAIKDGRQALRNYERDLSPRVFRNEINVDLCEVLQCLKCYAEQQWFQDMPEWFQQYLREKKTTLPKIYDQILTRTADYGSRFRKDNPVLSLAIQFLFEFDQETILNTSIFDQIWVTLLTNGRQGIAEYADDLTSKTIEEQSKNPESLLFLALQEYYSEPIKCLFEHPDVNIHRVATIELARTCIVDQGWWKGLHDQRVQDEISKNKFTKLIEKLIDYLRQNNLPLPMNGLSELDDSSPSLSSVSSSFTSMSLSNLNHTDTVSTETSIEEEKKKSEHQQILQCMCKDEVLQLSHLVQAGELIYVGKTLNTVLDEIIAEYASQRNFPAFIRSCFIPIMYLLKRHQNLNAFIECLFQKYIELESTLKSVNINLRILMDILLLNSDFSLSRKLMLLLSRRNPVPFLQPSLTDSSSYRFVSDIIHVWEYSIPVILSFGIGPCYGKSSILNSIFLSSFEQSSSNIYFQNTIDIDFGYNCLPPRSINIADAHGSMTKDLFKKIHELFDGFLIHVQYEYLWKHLDIVLDQMKTISQQEKYRLLLIRDIPKNGDNDAMLEQLNKMIQQRNCSLIVTRTVPTDLASKSNSIQTYFLPNTSNESDQMTRNYIRLLRNQILDQVTNSRIRDMDIINNELKHLMDADYKQHLRAMNQIVKPLTEKLINIASNPTRVEQYFPEYLQFVRLCELKLQSARFNFYGTESDTVVHEVRRCIFELEAVFKVVSNSYSVIFQLFLDVLKASDMITCLELLATQLKEERQCLVSTSDMAMKLPIEKSLSLEVLWRNAIVCSHRHRPEIQTFLQEQYFNYIQAGFPFEIVDGDNFYYQHAFLEQVFRPMRGQKILVISIIGPQNSGKSTLLNYMFGTLFDVRDGRCTRGIYGSFVKSNRPDYDSILLIDTEGLLGIEREDKEYDRRIVLFCLAVSHIVMVNMIGEVTVTVQDMLKLCADSLDKMGVTRIPQPIVHFILNQKADLNIENNRAAVQKIINDLKRERLDKSIDIREETFHTLPSAFKREGQTIMSDSKSISVVNTAPDFIECVQALSGRILHPTDPSLTRTSETCDPLQWLSSSITVFDTLQKFPDLTYYQDLHARRIDDKVREHIKKKILEMSSTDYADQLMVETVNRNENEIKDIFLARRNHIEDTARQDMEELFKSLQVPQELRHRNQQFLQVQIIALFNALHISITAAHEKETVKLLVQHGQGDLQKLIERSVHGGQPQSADAAIRDFDDMYLEQAKIIQERYEPKERLRHAMKHIFSIYNIYEKECMFQYEKVIDHLEMLVTMNESQLPVNEYITSLTVYFSKLGYRECSVAKRDLNSTGTIIYSLNIINNLHYLNKKLLAETYQTFMDTYDPQIDIKKSKDKNVFVRLYEATKPRFRDKQLTTDDLNLIRSTDQFQMRVRQAIQEEKPPSLNGSQLQEKNMYLQISRLFDEVIKRVMETMQGGEANEVRQIRTELIQKIVGLINSLIIEIQNELSPFCLALSLLLKSTLHTCAIVLLTKYYYDEQMTHCSKTLAELEKKKDDLKRYFLSIVAPDSSIDKNYAIGFAQQLAEYSMEAYIGDANRIINIELKKYDHLNRKWVQDRCDALLLIKNDVSWYHDYIFNPNKIVKDFVDDLWKSIEVRINQNLVTSKSMHIGLLEEYFSCIQGQSIDIFHLIDFCFHVRTVGNCSKLR